jgi:O-acetyl-ADP-ribose deacetylase (regulator of RNase III)
VPSVFVNYRSAEQAGYAALLDRELTARFGAATVFRAPRSIPAGADFAASIVAGLRASAVVLAVIGPGWLAGVRSERRVVGGEADWVRWEIAEALDRGIRVIPVLVGGAALPVDDELPADLAGLARCQYLRLDDETIEAVLERLVGELTRVVPELAGGGPGSLLVRPVGVAARLGYVAGDILGVRSAGIWVNSENTDMEMARTSDYSISGIIRYWGARRDPAGRVTEDLIADELAAAVGGRRPVAPGSTFVTGGGELAASHGVRYVIHVAAVQGEPGSGFRPVRDLGRCVAAVLGEADRLAAADPAAATVLVPVLGAGAGGADVPSTVRTLVGAAVARLAGVAAVGTVLFLAYTPAERAAFAHLLGDADRFRPVDGDR